MSTGFDYTKAPVSAPADDFNIDDFQLPDVQAYDKSAEEIEVEKSFREIPPGEHALRVVGFIGKPKMETKEVYVGGQRRTFSAYSLIVKFGLAGDPASQVTDFFFLPPDDPSQLDAYFHGGSNAEGKGAGFHASKFYQFIERLGFSYPKGGNLPAEARRLGNWRNREIVATVEPGRPYYDATEGREKPGRNQVKLFSYKPAGSPTQGAFPAMAQPAPRPAARPATPGGAPSFQPVPAGLDNI
jgi:hypothetical protein